MIANAPLVSTVTDLHRKEMRNKAAVSRVLPGVTALPTNQPPDSVSAQNDSVQNASAQNHPAQNDSAPMSLRLWPGVLAVTLQWLAWVVLPRLLPEATVYGLLGGIGCGLIVFLWWLFFSRAPWSERVGVLVLMPVALFATSRFVHPSIANGAMGMMLPLFSVPVLSLALVGWAVSCSRLSRGPRRGDGRYGPTGMRGFHAAAHRRDERRRRFGSPLAVDANSRGTAPGLGRQRTVGPSVIGSPLVFNNSRNGEDGSQLAWLSWT